MATTLAHFTAPSTSTGTTLVFNAHADDGAGHTADDTVSITVVATTPATTSVTFIAPAVRAGTALTFKASCNLGNDDMTVTVMPHNEFAVQAGAEVPFNTQPVGT